MISEIKKEGASRGECGLLKKVKTVPQAVKLFFSPQGLEFCEKKNFPTLELFRKESAIDLKKAGIYVDAGDVKISPHRVVCIVGNTNATINVAGVEHVFLIILMHGAHATITATDYAVVRVLNVSGSYSITTDTTVKIL